MKQLMFVRHGRVDRPQGIYAEEDAVALSIAGAAGLARLRPAVAAFAPQRIVVSSVRRCRESAALLCPEPAVPLEYDSRLRERILTQLIGMTSELILAAYGKDFLALLRQGTELVHLPGEESIYEATDRVAVAVRDAVEGVADRVLVVAHGGPHSWLCCRLLGLGPTATRSFSLDEAHYSLFDFSDDGTFLRLCKMNCADAPEERDGRGTVAAV